MSEITVSKEVEMRFRNFYRCPKCKTTWQDDWDSTCDDRCPNCNLSVSPYNFIELTQTPETFLKDMFEFENCAECHRGERSHTAVPFLSGYFARCNPIKHRKREKSSKK